MLLVLGILQVIQIGGIGYLIWTNKKPVASTTPTTGVSYIDAKHEQKILDGLDL